MSADALATSSLDTLVVNEVSADTLDEDSAVMSESKVLNSVLTFVAPYSMY